MIPILFSPPLQQTEGRKFCRTENLIEYIWLMTPRIRTAVLCGFGWIKMTTVTLMGVKCSPEIDKIP